MFNRKNNVLLVMTLLIALGAASTASAGGSIFVGADFPTGGFGDVGKTGFTAGGYYTGSLLPIVELGGLVSYNDFSTDFGDLPEAERIFGDSINAWEIHALGQLNIVFLKAFLGLGFANHNLAADRSTDFSWQIGAAIDLMMLEIRLGYHQIPVDESSINWMKLTIGLTF